MYNLGEMQDMIIKRIQKNGAYIGLENSGRDDDILLPISEIENDDKVGSKVRVFVYKDGENRPIATKRTPKILLNEISHLEVKEITKIGAFLDWGLDKDLFLPFSEQTIQIKRGRKYLVALYIDKSSRLCATMRIREYLKNDSKYKENDWVTGIVYNIVDDLGAFIAVDGKYEAMLPEYEAKGIIVVGEDIQARVASVKEDGRINLTLKRMSYLEIDRDSEIILTTLKDNNGFLPYNDKSDPAIIRENFSMSKS
ncbi:MAG: RNA-binding protein, partial [Tissierellia bacterium]|nr:RNA-binding protein [Tissierellia bacterium]